MANAQTSASPTRMARLFDAEAELREAATEFSVGEGSKWETPEETHRYRNLRRKRLREAAVAFADLVVSFDLKLRM